MKRKFITIVGLALLLTLSFFSGVFASSGIHNITAAINDNLRITFNGSSFEPRETDGSTIQPIVYKNRTYLPVRAICDLAGIDVVYNQQTNTIALSSPVAPASDPSAPAVDNLSTTGSSTNQQTYTMQQITNLDSITVSYFKGYFSVKVDRTKLPGNVKNFTKLSVMTTDDISQKSLIPALTDQVTNGLGVLDYDEVNGYLESYGGAHTVVMFYDDNMKLLAYLIAK